MKIKEKEMQSYMIAWIINKFDIATTVTIS